MAAVRVLQLSASSSLEVLNVVERVNSVVVVVVVQQQLQLALLSVVQQSQEVQEELQVG